MNSSLSKPKSLKREPTKRVSVVHIFLIREGQILLLKRQNTGRDDGKYGLPAGKMEQGEQPEETAFREAEEECGVRLDKSSLRMTGILQIAATGEHGDERIDFFFAAEHGDEQPVNREPDKCAELRWCRPEQLPAETLPYVRQAWKRHADNNGLWFDTSGYSRLDDAEQDKL